MQTRTRDSFTTIRTEGGLLPPDLLHRILDPRDKDVPGKSPDSYHLAKGERINEVAARAWTRLTGAWSSFRAETEGLQKDDWGTTPTRERWLLILFQELGYGRLSAAGKATELEGKTYSISHLWGSSPIHLVGFRIDLDMRSAGVPGAARTSPHSLVQEFLNRSDDHLWGFVSNGLRLRILRDNVSMTRQAYVEFDLGSMMDGEVYSDFVLLWMLCHQSRVESEVPEECWLEKWTLTARKRGTRALEGLRQGVEDAIGALGGGFLAHSGNQKLKERLRSGELTTQEYYHQVLRLVYRLLFLFVAEDRDLLLSPDANPSSRDLYLEHHSMSRLRRLAESRRGTRHYDLYRGLQVVMGSLGDDEGRPELGLPALGSFLWSDDAIPDLSSADIANRDILSAVRELSLTEEGGLRRQVDYKNLGPEELGSVYESLLELHPDIDVDAAEFRLEVAPGHERKSTGSYYTPESLVQCLLDSALDPVLDEAASQNESEKALLSLKICDPACGSGHFLLAAAHRVAKRLAAIRTGDEEPSPEATRAALRDVIGRCLYGVDINPMAVELCKVALWMEALEPGKPLSFLDHRIQCGNSLLGATPALVERGIPDEAFKPIEGDEKTFASALKKQNRQERRGQTSLFASLVAESKATYAGFKTAMEELDQLDDESIARVHRKEEKYRKFTETEDYAHAKLVADAWCAAFVWRKVREAPPAITHDAFIQLREVPDSVSDPVRSEVERLTGIYDFFHWNLAFPDVFSTSHDPHGGTSKSAGGFDVVLGNPPWEHTELKEKEWFAVRRPEIAQAPTGARRKEMIAAVAREDPVLFDEFRFAKRLHDGVGHFASDSQRYPLCGRGRINTYALFAEFMRELVAIGGRVGCVVPLGIATDHTTRHFFVDLMRSGALVSLYGFENEELLFPSVHHATKFCLLTISGCLQPDGRSPEFAFFLRQVSSLRERERRFELSAEDIALVNPNTGTCPVFHCRRDARLTTQVYQRVPVLIKEGPPDENPWRMTFKQGLFNMASDSGLFRTREELEGEGFALEGNFFKRGGERYLPLYEAKMIHLFDHRFGTYAGQTPAQANQGKLPEVSEAQHGDPGLVPLSRYWVQSVEVEARLAGRWPHGWLMSWRDITSAVVLRTVIATAVPRVAVGHTAPLMLPSGVDVRRAMCLQCNLSAFVLDYVARQKLGGTHLTFGCLNQLPIPGPAAFQASVPWPPVATWEDWLMPRALELDYTAYDLEPLAEQCGYRGPPFRWDRDRRFLLRCELDAAFFHLYGVDRDDADYIMETFPIVRRRDEKEHGEYRTSRVILEIYDDMAEAIRSGKSCQTRLDPPPADSRVAHAPRDDVDSKP